MRFSARATLDRRNVAASAAPLTDEQRQLVEQYVDAFQRYDVDSLLGLLRDDATLSMPPYTLWLQGPGTIRDWLLGRGAGCRGSRLVATAACGLPAFGQYRVGSELGTWRPWGLIVLELAGDGIAGWNTFLDTENLFPLFGLPSQPAAR